MIDEKIARVRSHGHNISRYQKLLRTKLSQLERQFIEGRLKEEEAAIEIISAQKIYRDHKLAMRE